MLQILIQICSKCNCSNYFIVLMWQCNEIFWLFSLIGEPTWAPNLQAKHFVLKNSFSWRDLNFKVEKLKRWEEEV